MRWLLKENPVREIVCLVVSELALTAVGCFSVALRPQKP